MGTPIFVARLRVTNGGGTFDSLNPNPNAPQPRIVFDVTKTLANTPNTARVQVYNLAPATVAKVTGVVRRRYDWTPAEKAELLARGASAEPFETIADAYGFAAIELSWGYADSTDSDITPALRVGFIGQSNKIREVPSGTDRILTFDVQDGAHLLGAGAVMQRSGSGVVPYRYKSYGPGTKAADVVVDLANACGLAVERDDIDQAIQAQLLARGLPVADATLSSYTSAGPALPQLESFLKALDLRWSVQDGTLLLLGENDVIPGLPPLRLTSEANNIVGQPEIVEDGRVALSTWADAEARPGRQVDVLTDAISASYRIDEASTSGDTYSGATTSLRLDAVQTIPGVF